MLIPALVLSVITGVYALSVFLVFLGWKRIEPLGPDDFEPKVTLLIPARNESGRIKSLLKSIQRLNYPKQKIQTILIDDYSEDDTVNEAKAIMGKELEIIRLSAAGDGVFGKKTAIETGVRHADYSILITLDADSTVPPDWLRRIVNPFRDAKINLVAGPVLFSVQPGILNKFQQLDMLANNGMAGAGFYFEQAFLCNGTNLAFRKEAFSKVGGFEGNKHLASGDDVFLLQKINKAYPGTVRYIKDAKAIVTTAPAESVSAFINQRKRWASKSMELQTALLGGLLIAGYLLHFILLLVPLWFLIAPGFILYYVFVFFIKFLIEYLLISKVGKDLQKKVNVLSLFFISLLYIPYVVMVGILAIFTKYKWKGRVIKK